MELFNIDPGLAIWTWISFGILFFILWKFVFPPLMKNLKNREETIAQSVDKAARIEERLSDIEKEHAQILKRSQFEADEILRKTRAEAEGVRQKLLEKAENEALEILDQAKLKIAEERESAIASLRTQIAEFVCDASEKVIGKSFTDQNDREWARELVKRI
jgi:F-type H+-transporting ATPase subunit b